VKIDTIELSGWMPFAGSFTLTLPNGPIAVFGSHSGDSRRSNRAGKTSLLEAITWCLFGTHRKRLDDAIINRSVQECVVTVTIGRTLRVRRSRKRGSSTKLVVTDYDILAGKEVELTGDAAQNEIASAIGLGLDDYQATSCFRQGDVESIVSLSAGDRLTLVSEWLQQSRWFDAKKLQAVKTNAAEMRLAEKRAAVQMASSFIVPDDDRQKLRSRFSELQLQCGGLDIEMKAVSNLLMESVEAKSQLATHRDLKGLRLQAADLRKRLANRHEADAKRDQAAESESVARHNYSGAAEAIKELESVRESGFDGVCPITCEQCPAAKHVTEVVQTASALFVERSEEYERLRQIWDKARAMHDATKRESAEFERLSAQYQSVIERGKKLAVSVTMTEEEAEAAASSQPKLQAELEELKRRFSEGLQEATKIESMLLNTERDDQRYSQACSEVLRAEAAAISSRLALRAISSVPARIAAQQLGELEQEANSLLQGSGVSLRFSWARELADKAPSCEECGFVFPSKRGDVCPTCGAPRGKKRSQELELLCDDGSGIEEDVRFNSGGTRGIVGASIRLAASAMLRRLRSSQAAWAIVDEPFGMLDAENREQLARTFAGMLSSVGLEQALVVSHDPVLLSALPHRIIVDKDGSSSTVRVA
jgi:DNA repair exonuclease SbcCD ATPase subunit